MPRQAYLSSVDRSLAYPRVVCVNSSNVPDMLSPAEVASYLGISVHTLASWRRTTVLPPKGPPWIEVEGSIRYPRPELDAWLSARTRNGSAVA